MMLFDQSRKMKRTVQPYINISQNKSQQIQANKPQQNFNTKLTPKLQNQFVKLIKNPIKHNTFISQRISTFETDKYPITFLTLKEKTHTTRKKAVTKPPTKMPNPKNNKLKLKSIHYKISKELVTCCDQRGKKSPATPPQLTPS